MKLLIKNGRLVDPVSAAVFLTDLLVENGKVALVERGIQVQADQTIQASGLVVSPGLVDMHVHLRDPGLTYKEDILTGALAAARGGITSLACMANTSPVLDSPEQIRYVKEKASTGCGVNIYPVGAVSRGLQGEELTDFEALKQAGAVALSDDGNNIDDANLMRDALIRGRRQKLTILAHCENTTMVDGRAVNEGSVSRQLWLEGRPAIAEELVVMRDAMLAEETRGAVHICHISTAKAVDIVRRMKKKKVAVTCETCPQYFTLTEDEILVQGSQARVNPPLRTEKDVRGIIAGLRDGTIDAIATDHAPHSAEEKARGLTRAPSGMVGLETSLAVTLTQLYHTGKMELPEIIRRMTVNPAGILQISKGRLSLGCDADITVFDPDEEWIVDPEQFASKGRNTPFAGRKVKGKVKYTIAGGRIIYRDGM
ncbi:MAG: dihydroorotase [Lawsonibacter sp.]|nr:dihydroorotase [Lawsonibacter sp.]